MIQHFRHCAVLLIILIAGIPSINTALAQDYPAIVINEINCDNPGGADNAEFIELFGLPETSLDSLVLVLFEGTDDLSYAAFDLDGYTLDENGFFIIGSSLTENVDLVITNGIISNGPDGIGLYHADAEDFPAGSQPTPADLIDAAVYGTSDPVDLTLLNALGLSAAGYIQLDETLQTTQPDFSLSRLPDGGAPFQHLIFVVQPITPGNYNLPPCNSNMLAFDNQETDTIFCATSIEYILSFQSDSETTGGNILYLITDEQENLVDTTSSNSFDFIGFPIAIYEIHALHYEGNFLDPTILPGINISDITTDVCFALSQNNLVVEITNCSSCEAGAISSSFGSELALCQASDMELQLEHEPFPGNDFYRYFLTSENQTIVTEIDENFSFEELLPGSYSIYGLAGIGTIDENSISPGNLISNIIADQCIDISTNAIHLIIENCIAPEPCTQPFISEYLEGIAGTRAIELFNPAMEAIDLSEYSIFLYTNGNETAIDTLVLSGTLEPLSAILITNPGTGAGNGLADPEVVALGDIVDFIANFTGNDAIELRRDNNVIDVIGIVGEDPGNQTGWLTDNAGTSNFDLRRKAFVQTPTTNWTVSSYQWDSFPANNYEGLGNHFMYTCSDTLVAGFLDDTLYVEESDGQIHVTIQFQNITQPSELSISAIGGNADASDYTTILPSLLSFETNSGATTITIDLIDDLLPETEEELLLMLNSEEDIYWTHQFLVIIIDQSDENCDGGTIEHNNGITAIQQCADLQNPEIELTSNNVFPQANYLYVLADAMGNILDTTSNNTINLDNYGAGIFYITGLSYTGELNPLSIAAGNNFESVYADSCISYSSNIIEIERVHCQVTGCGAGEVLTSDGAIFQTYCVGAQVMFTPQNSSESIDDTYLYVVIDENNLILETFESEWNIALAPIASYRVYGLSYIGEIDANSLTAGTDIFNVTAEECTAISDNSIEVMIADCPIQEACGQLFFSEYIEETESNKAIEIYNPTPFAVELSSYSVKMYANGSANSTETINLSGLLLPYETFVIAGTGNGQTPTDELILAQADTLHPVANLSGNDAFELIFLDSVVDVIGKVGENPGQLGWIFGNASTSNHVLVRRPDVTVPNAEWEIVSGQWIAYDASDFSHLGAHSAFDCGLSNQQVAGFLTSSQTVSELNTSLTVALFTSNPGSPFDININFDGSADLNTDYNVISPQVFSVPFGQTIHEIQINILADLELEGTESIEILLTAPEQVLLGMSSSEILVEEILQSSNERFQTFEYWPNPASDKLSLKSNMLIDQTTIYDQHGRVVLHSSQRFIGATELQLNALPCGVYSIELKSGNDFIRKKLMIIK